MSDDARHDSGDEAVSPAHAGPEHAEPEEFAREQWGTRVGFILAAVGSAVGLGNIWRFPYITAEGGGAAFVALYILMTFFVGIPVMLGEFAVGRRTRLSPIGALREAGGPGWKLLGYLFVLTGFLILAFYSVIAGWVARYALVGIFAGYPADTAAYFNNVVATGWDAVGFHLFFMAATIAVVSGGIEKGIERAALFMMPMLFALVLGLAVWAATLDGGGAGYAFYLGLNFEELFSLETLANATAQAFFSLSLGMGALLTFASYLSRDESLPREGTIIAFSDFSVAFFAGLIVFPVIFALGLWGDVSGGSTVGALFISLPAGFIEMGMLGRVVGTLFFVALFIGAITSAFSLLEVVTSSIIDEWEIERKPAAIGAGTLIALLGMLPAFDLAFLGLFDSITANVFLPLGGLMLAIFVGWLMKDPIEEVAEGTGGGVRKLLGVWIWLLRVAVPILLAIVLYQTIPQAWSSITGLFGG